VTRRGRRDLHGLLVLDKPAGATSAEVVTAIRRRFQVDRVGHTGTLDPMATGVLPLCLGEATKLAPYLLADDKAYEAELTLGVETDTLDADGAVVARAPEAAAGVSEAALREALAVWVGDRLQVPPMFSALRHEGRRLHQLARAGEEVERRPRPIAIRRLDLLEFDPPRARIRVDCSKGTYVRSLAADIGRALGCGAHLSALRRVRSGRFTLDQAVTLEDASAAHLVPLAAALDLPCLIIAFDQLRAVVDGRPVPLPFQLIQPVEITEELSTPGPGAEAAAPDLQLMTPGGALLALARRRGDHARLLRVFTYGLTDPATSATLAPRKGSTPD